MRTRSGEGLADLDLGAGVAPAAGEDGPGRGVVGEGAALAAGLEYRVVRVLVADAPEHLAAQEPAADHQAEEHRVGGEQDRLAGGRVAEAGAEDAQEQG